MLKGFNRKIDNLLNDLLKKKIILWVVVVYLLSKLKI